MKLTKKKTTLYKRIALLSGASLVFLLLVGFFISITIPFYGEDEVAIMDGINVENTDKIALEGQIQQVVKGYPIENMMPYIMEKDPKVAAFLVSIAKKESNLGKRVPVLDGQDCYNYWGYREVRDRMGSGGHTCFDSPKDAVDTVAGRIEKLIDAKVDTPKEMIVWKCGYSCDGHAPASVQKWITDVNYFFKKVYDQQKNI